MTDPTYDIQQQWEDMDPTTAHINQQAARIEALEADLAYANKRLGHAFERNDRQAKTIEELDVKLQKAVCGLESIKQYGSDTLSGRTDGPDDWEWQRAAVLEMTQAARATLAQIKGDAKDTPND